MKSAHQYILFIVLLISINSLSQSPGLIVRPAGGIGITLLNPNGNAYSSLTTAGFVLNDIVESEINYSVVPAAITEPTGDLATGPSGGFSDIVKYVDGSGFYMTRIGSNLYFRLRIGNIISGSKGYSVLIDTDEMMGSSGPSADPNYAAPSGSGPGNPGFEYEVVLQTNFQVAVYNIDGTATPGSPANTYSLNSNSQISVALSTDGNNPDYFYDWVVPVSAIGNPSTIRTAVTTVTSPNSALQGTRSDIYGIDDALYSSTSSAWQTVVNAQPAINLNSFTGIGATCTASPVITVPVASGINIAVNGTWTKMDASKPSTATITLYKNGIIAGTTTVTSGSSWTINVLSLAVGDTVYAKALAVGESQCLQSNNVAVSGCTSAPSTPVLTCASTKGISGTMAAGSTISVYLVPITNASATSNLLSNISNLTYPTSTSFAFISNGCSGSPILATGTYMIVANNGCSSTPRFECITSGSSTTIGLSANALSLNSTVYPYQTSISGTGAALNDILRLFINGKYFSTVTAMGSAFTFTGLKLSAGDQLQIYSQSAAACMTQSAVFAVSCFTPPPIIIANSTGNLLTGATSISGTSASGGASVQLYKGTAPTGTVVGSPVTTNANGSWSVTTSALTGGDRYYAVITANGCSSAASVGVTVATPAVCPTITGNYTEASTTVTGTLPSSFTGTVRLYADGVLIGSQNIAAATSWSITPSTGSLYYGGVLSATAQITGGAESQGCASKTVDCTSPLTPVITPLSSTIFTGQTVNFSVSNVNAGAWYALSNNSGTSFATSLYTTAGNNFSLLSNVFATAGTYNLKLSANALTGCPASFTTATVVVNNISLPVHFVNVRVKKEKNANVIYWQTANEVQVARFEVEKSTDGINFVSIGKVEPDISGGYHYADQTENSGKTFYRIREMDIDGGYQLSNIVSIVFSATEKFIIYPNPARGKLYIELYVEKQVSATIVLTDVFGKKWIQRVISLAEGNNTCSLDNLPASNGAYFLTVLYPGVKLSKPVFTR